MECAFHKLKYYRIPRSIAVRMPFSWFCRKYDGVYRPGDEGGLMWDDPAIGIEWPGLDG